MAEGRVYACTHCDKRIEAWDEGNPWTWLHLIPIEFRSEFMPEQASEECSDDPVKIDCYHPRPSGIPIVGNDVEHLCLACGHEFLFDIAAQDSDDEPPPPCPACKSSKTTDCWLLEGKSCPFCGSGHLKADPDTFMVS